MFGRGRVVSVIVCWHWRPARTQLKGLGGPSCYRFDMGCRVFMSTRNAQKIRIFLDVRQETLPKKGQTMDSQPWIFHMQQRYRKILGIPPNFHSLGVCNGLCGECTSKSAAGCGFFYGCLAKHFRNASISCHWNLNWVGGCWQGCGRRKTSSSGS